MAWLNISALQWNPLLLLSGGIMLWMYLHLTRYQLTCRTGLFTGGIVLAEIALALPMGPAAGEPLFSLHMARHVLLLMVAPPLMVAGLPEQGVRHFLRQHQLRSAAGTLLNPLAAWLLGVGIMWFWHAPVVFNSMVVQEGGEVLQYGLMATESLSLLLIGLLFCAPVLFPLAEYRLPPLQGIVYLFTACWACSILGILITFASPGLYHTVFTGGETLVWGLSQQTDQQLGGLLMWVPGCIIYVTGVIVLLVRWFTREDPAHGSVPKQPSTVNK